ncbi:hypothetical protein BsIDN1_44780 [Bacillus safensis]|uniref:Uncharacterized protein n=1 Tax=Bacillus safensis TaxID=561879 RepID=A0A5S9MBG1_BACIA|nr:hypothetical protein BsIDN1_44780 [Bacillus safensis]
MKTEGKTITSEAAEQLVMLCGGSLSSLFQEVRKLSTYIGEREEIELADVNQLVARSLEQNIFELINQIVNRRRSEAMQMFFMTC